MSAMVHKFKDTKLSSVALKSDKVRQVCIGGGGICTRTIKSGVISLYDIDSTLLPSFVERFPCRPKTFRLPL